MPGRFEVLGHQPLVIVDGAHNPPGADTCAQVFFDDFDPDGRRILVVGTLREPTAMLEALRADEFDVVVACTAPSPRGVAGAATSPRRRVALGCDEVVAVRHGRARPARVAMRMRRRRRRRSSSPARCTSSARPARRSLERSP